MSIKKKLLLYPFDINMFPVLRHKDMLKIDYEIVSCVSPKGWHITRKDDGFDDDFNYGEHIFNEDFDLSLQKGDAVWFCESDREMDFNSFIYPKMIKAIENGKDIITSLELLDKKEEIKGKCEAHNVAFINLLEQKTKDPILYNKALYKVEVPVIAVASLISNSKKFQTQLALRKYFTEMGYKVSQIGSRNYCEVFGFHSFPRFMYSTEYTEDEKIIRFNNYLVEVEHLEKPDVILLGIPGGVMPINDRDIGNFGVKAFEVSQAVVPDVTILNTQYEAGVNEEYYKNFAKQIRNKFGFEVNFFNIVDKCIDWQNVNMYNVFNYCTIASDRIEVLKEDIRNSSDLSIYSAVKESDLKELAENVIDTLASYAEDIEAI